MSGGEGDRGVVVRIAEGARRFRVRGRRLRGGRGEVGRQRRVEGKEVRRGGGGEVEVEVGGRGGAAASSTRRGVLVARTRVRRLALVPVRVDDAVEGRTVRLLVRVEVVLRDGRRRGGVVAVEGGVAVKGGGRGCERVVRFGRGVGEMGEGADGGSTGCDGDGVGASVGVGEGGRASVAGVPFGASAAVGKLLDALVKGTGNKGNDAPRSQSALGSGPSAPTTPASPSATRSSGARRRRAGSSSPRPRRRRARSSSPSPSSSGVPRLRRACSVELDLELCGSLARACWP